MARHAMTQSYKHCGSTDLQKKKKGKEVAESHLLNGGLQRGSPQYNPKLLGSQQKACPARQVNMYREVQWYFT